MKKNSDILRKNTRTVHKISRQLKISRRRMCQTIRKFDKHGIVATRLGFQCPKKTTNQQERFIKREQFRDEINPLADLVRYANTNMNLSISTSTIGLILRQYNMASCIAPRKPKITPKQQ